MRVHSRMVKNEVKQATGRDKDRRIKSMSGEVALKEVRKIKIIYFLEHIKYTKSPKKNPNYVQFSRVNIVSPTALKYCSCVVPVVSYDHIYRSCRSIRE
jgi:hypothetical protein